MADVNANIGVHIDTSAALAELKNLQRQLANFHSSVAKNSAASAAAQKNLQTNLLNSINATGKFTAQMGTVRTSTESFTHALESNKLTMREYFRFAGGSTKTFGRLFKQEFDTIGKVAQERVKTMQTQFIKMGRDASGAMQAMAIRPTTLNMNDYATKTALAAQKQALFNQLMRQGSTNLLNFGKNTQWAGRQLMVGFTVPLAYFGSMAAKTFMELEAQAVKFRRVYGEMFTTTEETTKALSEIQQIAKEFTKYGIEVSKTMEMAASAAAMGKIGADLTAQVVEATRLAVLGAVEQEESLKTTISLTNTFGISAADLASKIDFLNAVENQTVVAIEDLTIAIPKAGPVVKQLGGDVEDLAFFLTAMKEGGINASEGANALKSGLASLINPTEKASKMLEGFGISINTIVESNQGNIRQTVIDFARALDTLDPLNRARAIEQLFGKFQFSRLSTLFQNVVKDGTQASRVLELAGSSMEQLAILSERELKTLEDAVGVQFKSAVEELKLAIAPIGKTFLEAVTPIVRIVGDLLEKFNGLSDGTKKFLVVATTVVGVIGPVLLMTFGLLANGVANIIKLFLAMRIGFLKLGGNSKILAQQTDYLNTEQLEAATVAASLNQAHTRLTQSFTAETSAVRLLRQAYIDATVAAANFARANPGMMMPGRKGATPKKFAKGTPYVPGTGTGDTVASLLTPGEAVIPRDIAQNPQFQPLIEALVSGQIQKFEEGTVNVGGRSFTTRSQASGLSLQNKISELMSKGYSEDKILKALERNVEQGRPMTASQLERRLSIGRGAGTGTSAPSAIRSLAKQSQSGFMRESRAIKEVLKRQGIVLTPAQEKNLFNVQASHIEEVRNAGVKQWKANNLVADLGYVNNYLNTVKGKLGQKLLGMPDEQLRSMGIDRNELKKLQSGTHPTNARAAETLRGVARYDASINPKSYQAKAVLAGLEYRSKSNFYSQPMKTLADILPTRGKRTKTGVVDGQTGRAKSPALSVVGGGVGDRRQVAVGKGEAILNKKTTSALRSGRPAFIPGLGRLRIAGAQEGIPTGQKTGSTTVGAVSQSAQLSRAQLIAATEKISLKEAKRRIAAEGRLANAMDESTKAQMTTKEKLTQFSSKAGMGIGAVSGLTIAASFAGGKIGEMAQAIMPFVFGLQGITMLLPLLANPWVAAIAAIALVGGVMLKMAKDVEKARQEGVNLAKAMSMTSEKLQSLSVITGTVSATEAANRRRQNLVSGTTDAQRQFGQNVLGSEFGKGLMADIETQAESGQGIQEIGRNISNSLAYAIVQGVITTDQAKSISAALGEELKSYEIPAIVSGRLTNLLGPNGENLITDPLKITFAIQEESMTRQAEFFKTAIENIKPTVGLSSKQTILGAAGIGALGFGAVGAMAGGIGAVPGAIAGGVLGAASGIGASLSEKGARESNAKLGAAALQLGLEQVTMNNGLVDSLNKQYDIKVKMAKTDAEIKTIEKERQAALDTLNAKNSQALNLLIAQKDNFGPDIFTKGINAAIDTLYKDGPMKVFADEAKKELEGIKDADFKAMLQVQFASGSIDPVTVMKLANNEELQSKFAIMVESQGSEQANVLLQLLMKAGASDTNLPVFMDILNKDPENFDKNMKAISVLANMQQKYGITIDVNDDGAAQIKEVVAITERLAGITGEELTKEAFLDLGITGDMTGPEFDQLWTALVGTSKTINKSVIIDFVAAGDRNVLSAYLAAQGITQLRGRGAAAQKKMYLDAAKADLVGRQGKLDQGKIPGQTNGIGEDTGTRDTTFDDILTNLKRTRNATINAQGGAKELIRILSGAKDLRAFSGIDQQLSKLGANSDFIDFVGGLEKAIQNKIINVSKKGVVSLTELGKATKKAYDEKQLGLFSAANAQVISESIKQRDAFIKLKTAGVETADAQKMLADAIFMTSLAAQKNPAEIRKMIAEYKNMRLEVQKTLEFTNPEEAFDVEMDKAMKYYDFLEREARAAAKPEIDRINDLIDANDKLIEGMQRNVEVNYNRPIEKFNQDLAIIDRAAEGINKKYDEQEKALTKISEINQEIAQQEKGRLNLADALSRGDIAAAATAAQQMRADAAQNAMGRSSGALQAAREAEIAGLTVGGLTKAQIEEKIYNLEQLRLPILASIRDLQDKNYNLQVNQLQPLQEALDKKIKDIDMSRTAFENQKLAIEAAGFAADGTNKKFQTGIGIVDTVKRIWESIKDQTRTLTINTVYTTSGAGAGAVPKADSNVTPGAKSTGSTVPVKSGDTLSGIAAKAGVNVSDLIKANPQISNPNLIKPGQIIKIPGKMYGGKIMAMNYGGMVPKYMAIGGAVGSDTVPTMLTPGEFVINKAATKQFGPMLEEINNSKFPSMIKDMTPAAYSSSNSFIVSPTTTSVARTVADNSSTMYNYNIGITVPQSNASSNDIARAVIGQIQYIDSQRIRGKR
jgi:TP901 family phage tail tape measure protein